MNHGQRTRRACILVMVAGLTACDSGTAPAPLRGEFVLTRVNESAPPVIVGRWSPGYTAVTKGTVSIQSDTLLNRMLEFVDVTPDGPDSTVWVSHFEYFGLYRRHADTLFITYPPQESVAIFGEDTGFVSPTQLVIGLRPTLSYGSNRLVYSRR